MGSDPPHNQVPLSSITSNNSPSLGTHNTPEQQLRPDSPKPLSEEDIIHMRSRVMDMGLGIGTKLPSNTEAGSMTLREKELGGMVVKLLDSFIDPAQLHRQAEFINWLGVQRDLLVQSFEEERRRWEAEREGWSRMAEALLSQRAKATHPSQRDEELERQRAAYESENKSLREKVHDSHSRFSTLELELSKLKPLLLMQAPSHPTALSFEPLSTSHMKHSIESGSSKERRKALDSPIVEEPEPKDSATTPREHTDTPQTHPHTHIDPARNQPRSDHYRRHSKSSFPSPLHPRISSYSTPTRSIFSATQTPATHHLSRKSRSKHKKYLSSNLPSLTADARTEHLLLAARKIGRERASAVSGLMRRVEKEKEDLAHEKEAERIDRERLDRVAVGVGGSSYYRKGSVDSVTSPGPSTAPAMPKTPKRGANTAQTTTHFLTPTLMTPHSDFHPPPNQTPNSFVFVGTPATTPYQTSMASTPRTVGQTTHSGVKLARTPPVPSTSTSHPTPLASLLSAAKSMMDDESSSTSNSRRRTGVLEPPESPVPKRRKVGSGNSTNGRGSVDILGATSTLGPDRARSALDVLADQAAAAFDSDWQSPTKSQVKPSSKNKGKGKGSGFTMLTRSAIPSEKDGMDSDSTLKGRARITTHDSHSRSTVTGSPVPARSRSKALLTDRLPKEQSKTPRHRKLDKTTVDVQRRNAPAPRVIFHPGARSSVPPLPSLSPTPPPPIPVSENQTTADLTPERSTKQGDSTSPNNGLSRRSKSPTSSSLGEVGRATTGSPSLDLADTNSIRRQQHGAVTLNTLSQDINQENNKASMGNQPAVTCVAGTQIDKDHGPHGERSSGSERVPDGNEEEAAGDMNKDVRAQSQSQARADRSFISDEDGPDTDADAEGEVDVDAEEETVIMDSSSMTHHGPLVPSLASPQSQLPSAHTITTSSNAGSFGTNNERNTGLV